MAVIRAASARRSSSNGSPPLNAKNAEVSFLCVHLMSGIRVLAHFNDFRALDGGGDQGLAVQRILRLLDQFDARVRRRVLRREDRAAMLIRQV